VSTDDVLLGLGLVLAIAVSSQLLAARLRLPAIVVLLPAGFVAGAATDVVHPDELLGALFQPFVSIAVGVILFEAGLRLTLRDVAPDARGTVVRMVGVGGLVTWVGVSAAAALLIGDVDNGVPVLIGAILVVSGPTVVLPLLAFVRPSHRVRTLLMWEGVLVDPVGALLGVLVFGAVRSASTDGQVVHPGAMLASIAVGAAVGLAGAALLWLLLRETQRTAPRQAIPATLMVVVAALVAADLVRDDSGFVAATLMGAILANQRRIDVSLTLDFSATLVQLLIGVLFVLIATSVSPAAVRDVLPEALALVAVMVLVVRPLAVALATARSALATRERMFVAWMAPRGIVAGATASGFGLQLESAGVNGAAKILPIVFVAIFGTVLVYGLTAAPVARLLGVAGKGGTTVLIVGGHPWARAIGETLRSAGLEVRLWAALAQQQTAAREAGLQAEPGRLMLDALSREAELEEVTDALVLTASDDFNALAAAELRIELGHGSVHRVAPAPEAHLHPPPDDHGVLGSAALTFDELSRRFDCGERLVAGPAGGGGPPRAGTPLFVVTAAGALLRRRRRRRSAGRAGRHGDRTDGRERLAGAAVRGRGPGGACHPIGMMTRRSRPVDDRRHDLRPGQFRTTMTWGFSSGRMYGVEWLVVAVGVRPRRRDVPRPARIA
jgi:NhaP-type Na+/H+ or K+/H+ antiporter